MIHKHCRIVILGAGAMGSATAYHLARRGERFLLIEQFELGHDRGSSHGEARITRHSYADLNYARLMPEAFLAWRRLEADASMVLYLRSGGASLCPSGEDYVAQVASCLETVGVPFRRMTGSEWNARSPEFRVANDYDVVFEPVLLASRAIHAMQELARVQGGDRTEIWENSPILRIDLDADLPTLLTETHRITADRLIITAGSWLGRLLPEFASRLRIERQQVLYFQPHLIEPFRLGRFPVFILNGAGADNAYYGMPEIFEGGIKIARHGGEAVDPDLDDRAIRSAYLSEVRTFLQSTLPALVEAPLIRSEICKYTVAANDDFLVGLHPTRPDVIVASPCSGHGFKFSVMIGDVLADLAMHGEMRHEIPSWQNIKT